MKIFNYLKSFNVIGIVLWLLLGVVIFFLIKYVWRFLSRYLGDGNPIVSLTEADKEVIAKNSGDFMSNKNYTYRSGAEYLYQKMYDTSGWGWFKDTDHAEVGNFMLTVKPEEFQLLSSVYLMYKESKTCWYDVVGRGDTLSDDLLDLFSSSEEAKYLSHVKHLL